LPRLSAVLRPQTPVETVEDAALYNEAEVRR
jgi:hypothetical protein